MGIIIGKHQATFLNTLPFTQQRDSDTTKQALKSEGTTAIQKDNSCLASASD